LTTLISISKQIQNELYEKDKHHNDEKAETEQKPDHCVNR
jgi:hypothetical protein